MTTDDLRDDRRYPPSAVAPLFGVTRQIVSSWCRKGILPSIRLPGGSHFRILGSDAKALFRQSLTVRPVRSEASRARVIAKDLRIIEEIKRMIRQPVPVS